jgi:hypothetical protein
MKHRKLCAIRPSGSRASRAVENPMTRALLCSVLLLSLSCSSSGSDNGNAAGGSGNNNAGGRNQNESGAGNGTAGAGGASAAAGAAGGSTKGGAGGSTAASNVSVTQWGNDIAHTGHWLDATLTKANVKNVALPAPAGLAKMTMDTFTAPADPTTEYAGKFAGELAALPLYLASATAGSAGEYIAVTTQNDVYAFNATTGVLNWKQNIGANLGVGGSACGTPTNHGIVSTPVIDATARVIYLAAGMGTNPTHHEIHALAADTGTEVNTPGWPVDVSKIKAGNLAFPSAVQIQRSALALVGGIVYVAFGGYCGDGGDYHGWVVAVNAKTPTLTGAWATMDPRQGGIWAPGGLASDGNGVFAVTGNVQAATGADHSTSDSEEIIRVTGMGVASHLAKDVFYPTEWSPMNVSDLDFGSSSPAIITVPNSTPSSVIVAPAKPGRVYFLDATNLGASLGQFADMAVADTSGQSLYTSPTGYQSATGVHVALITGTGSQCPGGKTNDGSVMSILMQPGATATQAPMPKMAWCATIATDATTKRSPISTNSTGNADPLVWAINGSKLNAFDGDTGDLVFDGGTGTCGGVHSFTSLIDANGHLVAGGDAAGQAHLCSWSVHN